MRHSLSFFWRFVRHPRSVGAIAPSGKLLSKRMVEGLDLGHEQSLVEFGPGTGPFTRAIREVIEHPKQYLGVELDGGFVRRLRQRFDDLMFVQGGAADAPQYVQAAQLPPVQAIVCGLPFASLPGVVQDGVIAAIDTLLPAGGEFRTFQYVHAYAMPSAVRYRQRMTALFGPCDRSRPVVANMPPAYVLTWRKPFKPSPPKK